LSFLGPTDPLNPPQPLASPLDEFWRSLNQMSPEEVRKNLGLSVWTERKARLATEWLAHQESSRASAENAASLAEARSANDLAREANASAQEANSIARAASASAKRSANQARISNVIAALALAAAMIAIVVSIIGLRHTDEHGNAAQTNAQAQTH
jgi:hypothetical protein